ncbi:hypothetical protein VaNZ11_012656 [Volvox africanus]|uniref:Guanylate cyclase domain-containing protein n=1 Tax=Volvox africanus TaxID=51714 RepID=A0ABQ5SEE4_9CHLO|nr:hypothetical protein VaNZ11_012656 [Volvox africanus]
MLPEVRRCEMDNRDRLLVEACGLEVLLGVFDRDGNALALNDAARPFFTGKYTGGCPHVGAPSASGISDSAATDVLPATDSCCLARFFRLEPQAYTDLHAAIHRGEANFSIVLPVPVPVPEPAAVTPPQPPLSPPTSPPPAPSFTIGVPSEMRRGMAASSPRPNTVSKRQPPPLPLPPEEGQDGVLHAWLLSAGEDRSYGHNHAGGNFGCRVVSIGRASGSGVGGTDSDIGGGSTPPGVTENVESPPASRVVQRPLRLPRSSADGNASGSWADEDTSSDSEGPLPLSPLLPLLPTPSSLFPPTHQQPWQHQAPQQLRPQQTQHAFPIASFPIAVPGAPPILEFPSELPLAAHIAHGSRISLSSSSSSAAPSQSTSLHTRAQSGVSSAGGWRLLTPALSRKWPRAPDGAEGGSPGGADSGSDYPQAPATPSNEAQTAGAADAQTFSAEAKSAASDVESEVEAAYHEAGLGDEGGVEMFGVAEDGGGGASGGEGRLLGVGGGQVGGGGQAAADSEVGEKDEVILIGGGECGNGDSGGGGSSSGVGEESSQAAAAAGGGGGGGGGGRGGGGGGGGGADVVSVVTAAVGHDDVAIGDVASAVSDDVMESGRPPGTTTWDGADESGSCSIIMQQELKRGMPPLPPLGPPPQPYSAPLSRHREGSATHDGVLPLLSASGGKEQGGVRSPFLADVGMLPAVLPTVQRRASECLQPLSGSCAAGGPHTTSAKCHNHHYNHHRHHNYRVHNHHSLADPNQHNSHQRSEPSPPSPPVCYTKCPSSGSTQPPMYGKNNRGPRRCTTRERLLNLLSSLDSDAVISAAASDGGPYTGSPGILSSSSNRPNGNAAGGNEAAGGLGCTTATMRDCSTSYVNRDRDRPDSSDRDSMDEVCGATCYCCDGSGRAQVCARRWGKTSPPTATATATATASDALRWASPSSCRSLDARNHTTHRFDGELSPGSPYSAVQCSQDGDLLLTHGSPQQTPGLLAGCGAAAIAHSAMRWSGAAAAATSTQWQPPPSHVSYMWFQVHIKVKKLPAEEVMAAVRQGGAMAAAAATTTTRITTAAAQGDTEDPASFPNATAAGGAGTCAVSVPVPSIEAGYSAAAARNGSPGAGSGAADASAGACTSAASAYTLGASAAATAVHAAATSHGPSSAATATATAGESATAGTALGGSAAAASEVVLLLSATDVSEWVDSQERLEGLLQEEHKVLEAIFPRHVIEHVARKALTRPPSSTFRPATCETNIAFSYSGAAAATSTAAAAATATRSKGFYSSSRSGGGEEAHTPNRPPTVPAAATVRSAAAHGPYASSGFPSDCMGCSTGTNTVPSVTSSGAAYLEHPGVPGGSHGIGAGGGGRGLAAEAAVAMACSGPMSLPNADGGCSGAGIAGDAAGCGGFLLPLATAHRCVTVLFADIVGFTTMCNCLEPLEVMNFLNGLYTRFDSLCDIYGVYKVETIGDCFMAVGGLITVDGEGFKAVRGDGSEDGLHALKVMSFAKAMLREVAALVMPHNGSPLRLRVGLHSGPITAGIVGSKMPRFCLFGDTVNTASRMESTCEPGAIHVSAATRELLPEEHWVATGGVQVKGKGEMQTYLWRLPPPLSECSSFGMGQLLSTRMSAASRVSSFQTLPPAGSAPPPGCASSWMAADGTGKSMESALPFEPLPEAASAPLPGSSSSPPLPSPPRALLPSPASRVGSGTCAVCWSAGIA